MMFLQVKNGLLKRSAKETLWSINIILLIKSNECNLQIKKLLEEGELRIQYCYKKGDDHYELKYIRDEEEVLLRSTINSRAERARCRRGEVEPPAR